MPAPLIPLVAKVVLSGAAFAGGYDIYNHGKKMIRENAPAVKEGLGGVKEGLGGAWDKLTDLLDPLDLFGQRRKREEDMQAQAAGQATKRERDRAKKEAQKEQRRDEKEREAIRREASARIADAEKRAKAAIEKATRDATSRVAQTRAEGQKALAEARRELARINALRTADQKAKQESQDSPLNAFLEAALLAVASGASAPEPNEYAAYMGPGFAVEEAADVYDAPDSPSWGDFV